MQHTVLSTPQADAAPVGLFGWAPQIDRLRREAAEARRLGRADPWTIAEAECWIELVDAELVAQRRLDDPDAVAAIRQLVSWRAELLEVIRRVRSAGISPASN
jgi:hypothetical protein